MAGNAITNNFMLGTATVMVGPQADALDLVPETHSIGLVKNFRLTSEPNYVDLTQGIRNNLVFSVMNQNNVRASMEVFEFTAQNLAYGLGLSGTKAAKTVKSNVDGAVTAAATTFDVTTGDGSNFTVGDNIMIKDGEDKMITFKVDSISTDTITVDRAIPVNIADNAEVFVVHKLEGGSKENQAFYSAKICGSLADGKPITLVLPKIRVQRGFDMAFSSEDYGNLPFEFATFDLVSTDALFSEFGTDTFRIFTQ